MRLSTLLVLVAIVGAAAQPKGANQRHELPEHIRKIARGVAADHAAGKLKGPLLGAHSALKSGKPQQPLRQENRKLPPAQKKQHVLSCAAIPLCKAAMTNDLKGLAVLMENASTVGAARGAAVDVRDSEYRTPVYTTYESLLLTP